MPDKIVSKIKKLLPALISKKLPREIKVVFLNTRESQKLNFIYRGKKKPTNVLSFFYGKDCGEILICPKIVKEEARKQGNSQLFQMTWMILHGMLHLAEIHHEESRVAARRFVRLEEKILEEFS